MSNLLHAGLHRYLKSKLFWLAVAVTAISSYLWGYWSREEYFEDMIYFVQFMIFAVLFSLEVGREFDEGVFRNKIVGGHSKSRIYISEMILAAEATCLMFFISSVVFAVLNPHVISIIPAEIIIKVYINSLTANIICSVMIVAISCILQRRIIAVTVCSLLLCLGLYSLSGSVYWLTEPRFYEVDAESVYDNLGENGTLSDAAIEDLHSFDGGTVIKKLENGSYLVESPLYRNKLYTAFVYCNGYLNPFSNMVMNCDMLYTCFGDSILSEYQQDGNTYYETLKPYYESDAMKENFLNKRLLAAPFLIVAYSGIGLAVYKRRNFR